MMHDLARLIILVVIAFAMTTNGSTQELPDWSLNSNRSEVGGKIYHWGTGVDASSEVAIFKAEQMAIKSIVDECGGFAHKSIVVAKKFVGSSADKSIKQAYALAGIEYVACQYGKTPMAKRNPDLENPKLVEGQRLYRDIIFSPSNVAREKVIDYQKEIDSIIHDVDELKRRSVVSGTYNTNITVKQVTIVGDKAKYEECMRDYRDLLGEAGPSITGGRPMEIYNKAQLKLYRCNQMKK